MGRRRILVAMLALSLGLLVRPVAVGSVVACSCVQDADPIVTAARDPLQAVFTGVVHEPAAQGTPVVLTRWFRGPRAAARGLAGQRGLRGSVWWQLRDGPAAGQHRVDLRRLPDRGGHPWGQHVLPARRARDG